MSRDGSELGSMVSKDQWVSYNLLINGAFLGGITH